jgi:hypothetical protein
MMPPSVKFRCHFVAIPHVVSTVADFCHCHIDIKRIQPCGRHSWKSYLLLNPTIKKPPNLAGGIFM